MDFLFSSSTIQLQSEKTLLSSVTQRRVKDPFTYKYCGSTTGQITPVYIKHDSMTAIRTLILLQVYNSMEYTNLSFFSSTIEQRVWSVVVSIYQQIGYHMHWSATCVGRNRLMRKLVNFSFSTNNISNNERLFHYRMLFANATRKIVINDSTRAK